ncbi:hypothetical protein J8F10_30145 [Gemmata sp. G18]|uniref:Uncharacterized protein n=1 Tax=Gemmata palustris TaxID=2822762 RepID=A0ABS5C0L4_9BACT|nr:hypothetical protein [Gemmata palustris]MBP3959527.1 hypothetical protein [Gemmata palustris]
MNHTTSYAILKRGWPWDEMELANQRFEDAKRREWKARIGEQRSELDEAISELNEAMAERQKLRDQLTDLVIGGLRIALEEQPEFLAAKLAEIPILATLLKDVAQIATAVANLEPLLPGGSR